MGGFAIIDAKTFQDVETSYVGAIGVVSERVVGLILVDNKPFVWICHGGDMVHPFPTFRDVIAVQEVATEQEEEGSEGNDCGVAQYVIRHN